MSRNDWGRIRRLRLGGGVPCISVARPSSVYGSNRVILPPWAWEAHVPYLKPVLAGLLASAIVYLCFLTWLHWKAVSLVKEQGATGLIAVTGAQVYVLHSPSFWALAFIAFGIVFFLFRIP